MEYVPHLAFELDDLALRDAEQRLVEIADNGDHLCFAGSQFLAQRDELLLRALAHQNVDRVASLEQVADQKAADETRATGDEVGHRDFLLERPIIRRVLRTAADCAFSMIVLAHALTIAG